jgi:hypothetical protein
MRLPVAYPFGACVIFYTTWSDTEPPSTIGSVQYVGGVASAYIYAVLVLQAANRYDD